MPRSRAARRARTAIVAAAALLVLLAAARALLPTLLERYVDGVLDRADHYSGSIGEVDVALWRGAYTIHDVDIRKRDGDVPVPFVAAPAVDLSVQWRALFRGALVGEIAFHGLELNFVAAPTDAAQQAGGADWRDVVADLFPVRVDHVEIHDGRVHFRDFHAEPEVDVALEQLELYAENLTNSRDARDDLIARLRADARLGSGRVTTRAAFDPLADPPEFDVDLSVRDADLREWNDFFRAYAGVDVQAGRLSLFAEMLARDGRFEGYAKPLLEHVDVLDVEAEGDDQGVLSTAWEAVVGAVAEVFENQPTDRFATRIPIQGSVDSPEARFWPTLLATVRNAFVEALQPRLEQSIGR